jgi:hypothetical protein
VGMLHTQLGGNGCGGGGLFGIDRALGWLHLQTKRGGEVDKGLEGCMVGSGAPWRKVSWANSTGLARFMLATSSMGPCSVPVVSACKQEHAERVPVAHPALRIHDLVSLLHMQPGVPAVCPFHHRQQGRAALCHRREHAVSADGAESVFPVDLQGDTFGLCRQPGAESMTHSLASTRGALSH